MLFQSIIYGPIRSRRLGMSLGVNLMPTDCKQCSFDCVYCECGFLQPHLHPILPTREQVREALEQALQSLGEGQTPDVITFSGNGEPTMHPHFADIIDDTCTLRDKYCPKAKVSVLSNSTQLFRPDVTEALKKADNRIMKLDSAVTDTFRLIDVPVNKDLTPADIIEHLKLFNGDFTLQTCFLRGERDGKVIDNTIESELNAWYKAVRELRPKQIMIYVIDRATPVETLRKIPREEMQRIAEPLIQDGFDVQITA